MSAIKEEIKLLEEAVREELGMTKTPGLAVGVFKDDGLAYAKGFGVADIEKNIEVTPDTVFKFGSNSKLFTCIGIMQQYEKGKFDLDDPVNDYLPAGKLIPKKSSWKPVTFRHLLTHNAGIGELRQFSDIFKRGFRLLVYDNEPVPLLSSLHDLPLPLSTEPGSKFAYSNVGVSLLGYLTEVFSGEDFRDYMQNHILKPLGMSDSDFIRTPEIAQKEAKGYKDKKGRLKRSSDWINIVKPSGGLWSTVNDMGKFMNCLGNYGEYPGGRLLKKETFEMMWTPQYWAHDSFKERYCLGFIYWLYNSTKFESLNMVTNNPMTGPLFIEGAQAGDILKVEILDISVPERGVMTARKGEGLYGDLLNNNRCKVIPIKDNTADFNGIKIPLRPMIGGIGVATEKPRHATLPGPNGGNLDLKELTAGTVIYLPVLVEGDLNNVDEIIGRALGMAMEKNLSIVHPFDDPLIIAGQGTIGMEILDDLPDPDVVIVPVGGGGLISGIAAAVKLTCPGVKVYGVGPRDASSVARSFGQKEPVQLNDMPHTIADGIRTPVCGHYNLPIINKYVDGINSKIILLP